MSAPPERTAPNELVFFFETNEPVPARPLLDFISEVDRIARSGRHLGPDAVVEITEILTGTKLIRLTFDRRIALAGLAVAVTALGNDLVDRIQSPKGRLAESVARMCLDNGVARCVVATPEGSVWISRDDIPAVTRLTENRARTETRRSEDEAGEEALAFRAGDRLRAVPLDEARLVEDARALGDRSDRVYTLVGTLTPPESGGDRWSFVTQSGRKYAAVGVNPARSSISTAPVVLRASLMGRGGNGTLLNVADVFELDEP